MKLDDGRELLVKLSLPLNLELAGQLMHAVAQAAERLGYTGIHPVQVDGNGLGVAGIPPARPTVTTPRRKSDDQQLIPGEE